MFYPTDLHEGFVVVANFLDVDVKLGIDEWLHGATIKQTYKSRNRIVSFNLIITLKDKSIEKQNNNWIPIGIGDCYNGSGVLEVKRRLHLEFAKSSVCVADLEHGRQPRSRHLSSSNISFINSFIHSCRPHLILKQQQQQHRAVARHLVQDQHFSQASARPLGHSVQSGRMIVTWGL